MKVNEGTADRLIRIALGAGLIAATATGLLGVWAWVGVVPLATGLLGICPLYSIFGFKTCRTKGKK